MSISKPTISIVTRLSRPEFYLERVLDGLLLQSGAALFWSIVTQIPLSDGHKACLRRAEANGVTLHITKAKDGLSLGRLANIGVQATDSEFVMLHDDDDALNQDFIGPAIKSLLMNSDVAVVCHAAIIHEDRGEYRLDFILSPGRGYISRCDLLSDNKIATNGIIYRRSAFIDAAGYPEDVSVAEDWLFYLKLLKFGTMEIFPKVCAHVYIRSPLDTALNIQNTDRAQHERMRDQIRKMEGLADVQSPARTSVAIRYKLIRGMDRLIHKATGKFLPRI